MTDRYVHGQREQSSLTAVARSIEAAHAALWHSFIPENGLILDYVGELPTPEDCSQGRPNAIGWWSPIENGPMFTGQYLAAVCERARRTGEAADRAKASLLAKGLVLAASISNVPGFIARGVGTDGRCHYPLGSTDQTLPWFYGLHAYVTSDIPEDPERQQIIAKMEEVAIALAANDWHCPCDGAFAGEFRGEFKGELTELAPFRSVTHFLFVLRALADVTGKSKWLDLYRQERDACHAASGRPRLEFAAEGYVADVDYIPGIAPGLLWIYVGAQSALARLWELETDEHARYCYRTGLDANATRVLPYIQDYVKFDNTNQEPFGYARWREGYAWEPQATQQHAERIASTGNPEILGNRKRYERHGVTNPLSAACIAAFADGGVGQEAIARAITHYDYTTINICEFFLAECAYYALSAGN